MPELTLADILPNTRHQLHGTGFLFGAGTSVEAGYPMMSDLTRQVINALNSFERSVIDEALAAASVSYDSSTAMPNIEELVDIVTAHMVKSMDQRFSALEARFRELITEIILSVSNPKLDHHLQFFEHLKARTYGQACCINIFTTNYDILFEMAAALSGVVIETGFSGTIDRFFNPDQFSTICGQVDNGKFTSHPILTVRLFKLHGSISWKIRSSKIFESHPAAIGESEQRVMILPRRGKIIDTLQPPYDTLFSIASKVIGHECKYLASCGFSFGEDHINRNLLLPGIRAARFRLFTLCQDEPMGIAEFKTLPAFSAGFANARISAGKMQAGTTELWKFSRFVDLLA